MVNLAQGKNSLDKFQKKLQSKNTRKSPSGDGLVEKEEFEAALPGLTSPCASRSVNEL